jgi:aclacinomycin oxidase
MISRRSFLGSAVAAGGAAAGLLPASGVAAAPTTHRHGRTTIVRPGDPRYAKLAGRGYNTRFVGSPDEIWLVRNADDVERAVNRAIACDKRITVRSGGHCFESLVDNPQVRLLVDTSEMRRVTFDRRMNAFCVEAGARLGDVYRALYEGWGVTVPGGTCPEVGVGGHVSGGGYGPLSRRYGLIVDHLYAVEVVVAPRGHKARTIIATREPDDPHRDLWWAHTGGGGGGFGIVTRFWFRTPWATGGPRSLLPRPPSRMRKSVVSWPWDGLTEANFTRLVTNHNAWHAANSDPGSPYSVMHSSLSLFTWLAGRVDLEIRMDATLPDTDRLHDDYIAALSEGVGVEPTVDITEGTWLDIILEPTVTNEFTRSKSTGGHMRKVFTEDQIAAMYRALTDPNHFGGGFVYLASYGCAINTVAPAARAIPQRDSILKLWYCTVWDEPVLDEAEIEWLRALRGSVHAGGFPVPNDRQDGGYINYPDVDIRDPGQNRTGVPWYRIIWKDNYPRLQRVKNAYDPRNVFRHALSLDPT